MFMKHTNGMHQKLVNLKPLLLSRTNTVECVNALLTSKQSKRFASSKDGDRLNDEKFDNQTTTSTTSTTKQQEQKLKLKSKSDKKHHQPQQSTSRHANQKSQFISIEIFAKDIRLPLPGNVGFAENYSKSSSFKDRKLPKKLKEHERDFKLITDHNPQSKDCITTTIEANLNKFESCEDRQNRIVENVVFNEKDEKSLERNQTKYKSLFIVKVYPSTQFLLNDIQQLFPKECHFENDFVIISVYKNPSTKIDDIEIKEQFVQLAYGIAESLNNSGCWTNFLVPDSNRSLVDSITCLDEERFVNYGIEVDNYADCHFIRHVNNKKLFIGSVFTSAKLNSVELNRVLTFLTPPC